MSKMNIGGGRLSKSVQVRGAQGKDRSFSQFMNLGTSYRLFFPLWENADTPGTYDPDIVVCTKPVRKLNMDITGSSLYVLENFDEAEDGTITDLTNMEKYARVSAVLHDASYRVELNRKLRTLEDEAKQVGTKVDETVRKSTIQAVRKRYYGDEDKSKDVSEREFADVNRAISGVMLEIVTRVYIVPMSNSVPMFSNAQFAQLSLSTKKTTQLLTLLKNPDYFFDNKRPFFEVGFDYVGSSKKVAGLSATFQGISRDTSLESKAPDLWKSNVGVLNAMIRDPELIAAKNFNFSSSPSQEAVISSMMKYIASQPILLVNLDFDSTNMKYGAKPLFELGLLDSQPTVKQQVKEYIEENIDNDNDDGDTSTDNVIPDEVAENVGVEKITELDVEELGNVLANMDAE